MDPAGAGGSGGEQEEHRQREKARRRRRRRRQRGGREQRWRENGREEREGVRVCDLGRGLLQKRSAGFFYKNDRILEFFLLLVEIKISWRVYFVKILTWVGMFGAYLQFLDNRRSFLQNVQNKGSRHASPFLRGMRRCEH